MAVGYQAVLWNPFKKTYDLALAAGVILYIGAFLGVSALTAAPGHEISPPILIIRALGTCAFLMLTIILSIGPLARLNPFFLPLLYNRRHFGVTTFFIALIHAFIATGWYHGFGTVNPIVSLFTSSADYSTIATVPFEVFGVAAFLVLFVLAATSHDFWLANLSPPVWKALHMMVYGAYGALALHIALGILQDETSPLYWWVLGASVAFVGGLHMVAGLRQWLTDSANILPADGWQAVGAPASIGDNRARILQIEGADSIAVFRYGDRISAVSNLCAHQNGPLGEGKIVDGCITCPWHGYQYLPDSGQSPPPFQEKIATYRVRIDNGTVYVHPEPLPPGTPTPPAVIPPALMPA